MTISKQDGVQVVDCDTCGEQIERGEDCMHFAEWIDALKDEGWRLIKRGREWVHECPACSKESSR